MPVNSLQSWLTPFKATAAGQSLCALETPAEIASTASLQINSKAVQSGDVFLAIAGVGGHGNRFIANALAQGACWVLTDSLAAGDEVHAQHPQVLVWPDLPKVLPEVVSRFYQDAVKQLQLVAVTGTNGKSSTAIFINQFSELLGQPAGVIGTLGYGHYQQLTPLQNTTPHLVDLHRIFATFQQEGRQLAAMEVSSHALVQQRVAGLQFQTAIFTNLSRDHLDYHGTMEAYGEAKALLFAAHQSHNAVINVSDHFGQQLAKQLTIPMLAYGRFEDCKDFSHFIAYKDLVSARRGFQCTLVSPQGEFALEIPLLAEFNVQNVFAAMGAMVQLGHPLPKVIAAVGQLKSVPGRMELWNFPNDVAVIVDYAHTPDALAQTLQALRQQCQGKIWCVFGCGGDRDKGKRPLMGQIAELYADRVIITADNPRTESVLEICNDIVAGMTNATNCQIEPDRESAIQLALQAAQANDMVLIAGKGHENYQIIGDRVRDYDERKFIDALLAEMS